MKDGGFDEPLDELSDDLDEQSEQSEIQDVSKYATLGFVHFLLNFSGYNSSRKVGHISNERRHP